jgi:hypothetical protein
MLTKEQILSKMRGFGCPKYLTESCWQPIYDQCVAAIDLAAENERLKAKLDAVREIVLAASMPYRGPHADVLAIEEIYNLIVEDKDGVTRHDQMQAMQRQRGCPRV